MRDFAYYRPTKDVVWLGSSRSTLKSFPEDVMDEMGHQLFRLQCGLEPDDWKPMASIGPGVCEIRVRNSAGAFRVVYLANRPARIYVLHCFQKKSRKTARQDVDTAIRRLKSIPR